jgi:hypothetical protein
MSEACFSAGIAFLPRRRMSDALVEMRHPGVPHVTTLGLAAEPLASVFR